MHIVNILALAAFYKQAHCMHIVNFYGTLWQQFISMSIVHTLQFGNSVYKQTHYTHIVSFLWDICMYESLQEVPRS